MDAPRFDVLGIGNAIVDVVAPVPEAFLSKHGMHKGSMTLIDPATADTLYAAMPPGQESSGGSAAHTSAVAAASPISARSPPISWGMPSGATSQP